MPKFYALQIKMGKKTIDEIPERWREATRKLLEEEKK